MPYDQFPFTPATPPSTPSMPVTSVAPVVPAATHEPVAEPAPMLPQGVAAGNPTPKQQQWGVMISIVVIVGMIVVGAFYAWGKRIAENQKIIDQSTQNAAQQY